MKTARRLQWMAMVFVIAAVSERGFGTSDGGGSDGFVYGVLFVSGVICGCTAEIILTLERLAGETHDKH